MHTEYWSNKTVIWPSWMDGKCVFGWAESSLIVEGQHLMLKIEKAKSREKSILFFPFYWIY